MKQKQRIVFFSLSLRKGGAENQLTKLALFLQKTTNFDVSIVHFVKGNDFKDILLSNNIEFRRFSIKKPGELIGFIRFIAKFRPNLIISFMFGANMLARFVKLFYRIPLITSVRNNEISTLYRFLYRWTYKLDNTTTFNSQFALDKFIQKRLTSPKKSVLINNAISIFTKDYVERKNDIFTMVSVAHFRPQKDYRTLFEAVSLLRGENIEVKLFVLGHLFHNAWPNEVIERLGIGDQVEIVGFTNETTKYLEEADVLVLSSLWEGTPNAILEGMANYLPVVATDIPGVAELVNAAQCGLLFQPQNPVDLKEKIIEMINCPRDQRESFALSGYKYVIENYEDQKVYSNWKNIVNSVLSEK